VAWYPHGKGGPIIAEGPPPGAPVLIFSHGGAPVTAWGNQLTVGAPTPAGTFVVAIVERPRLPGASVSLGVLIPDVAVNGAPVAVHTIGVLASHREGSQIGPGQVETYTELSLQGTAASVILPL